MLQTEALETLQRELNEKLEELGLEYFVRIDNFDATARNFDFALSSRYSFESNEANEQATREIVLNLLTNWANNNLIFL